MAGVALRWLFVLHWHDPRDYVYSDMAVYVRVARQMAAGAALGPGDVTHPPGPSAVLAPLIRRDPSLALAVVVQLVVCALVPLAAGALGWVAFGPRCAAAAVAASSLYFPLIEYGGFFLAEVYFTVLLLGTMALLLASFDASRSRVALPLAALAGTGFSIAVAFKLLAVPTFAAVWGTYLLATRRGPGGARDTGGTLARLAAFVGGALPLLVVMADFCTSRNDGHFCVAGSKGPADFLLGHYGRIASLHWTDYWMSNPSAVMRGYTASPHLEYSMRDGARNLATAFAWMGRHPGETFVLSLDHLYDTFSGTAEWPSGLSALWPWAHLSGYVYVVFMLLPLVVGAVDAARARGVRALVAGRAFLVASPVVGLALAVLLTNGEPRYRNAFDGILLVLVCALVVRRAARRAT